MPSADQPRLLDPDIRGIKYFIKLLPLFQRLHEVGCERDKAGNRQLHFDEYCVQVMLYLFNPLIGSMNCLQQVSQLPGVMRKLGVKRFSAGSFSEAPAVFEPQRLKQIIEELAGELRPLGKDPRLSEVKQVLTLVDGSVLKGLVRLSQLATCINTGRDGKAIHGWRLHLQLELGSMVPYRTDVRGGRNSGDGRESNVLRQTLQANRCYVTDGGYADRTLFNDIVTAQSQYVCRIQENSVFKVLEERLLGDEALDANVVRDVVVELGRAGSEPMNHRVRIVEVQVTPHPRRTRHGERSSRKSDRLLIATSLLDLPAELIALIYLHRYSVELFFRFFKQLLGMRHLLSQRQEGVEIQTYCAVIACLLINLWTGRKPNKRMMEMIGWHLMGLASDQDLINHLNQPDMRGSKLRAQKELWKKLGF